MAKIKKFQELADDITIFTQDNDKYEKIKEPVEVIQITGVLSAEEIDKVSETTMVPVNLTAATKRGDVIWLTALIKKPGDYNSQSVAVIKARVVDIYQGLNALSRIQ